MGYYWTGTNFRSNTACINLGNNFNITVPGIDNQ